MEKLLLIEDDKGLREQLKWALRDNYCVFEAVCPKSAIQVYEKEKPPIVYLDMGLEDKPDCGLEIIDTLTSLNPLVKILVITANESEGLAEKAVAKGVCDYLTKPIDPIELNVLLARAVRMFRLECGHASGKSNGQSYDSAPNIVGKSKSMETIRDQINRLSKTDINVLVTGESGTGKELCARAIHAHSNRKNKPFVPINCGAIPENLVESELFGYVRGAFTGASYDKTGLIESANGGTLFLDEIGDMPKRLQVKLLRFLEDRFVQRIGETTLQKINVRIIAATNNSQSVLQDAGSLRHDLYYRLSEFEIHMPPLRDREGDIYLIAEHTLERNRMRFNTPNLQLTLAAKNALANYSWPGNIRELENKLNRATICCNNRVIDVADLELSLETLPQLSITDIKQTTEKTMALNELNVAVSALKLTNNNVSAAAKKIGVSRTTFYSMMKRHGISLRDEKK